MFINTHIKMSQNILSNIDQKKSIIINEKNFIYGNIKPDATSKYKLIRHYMDESFDMIISKIKHMCNLSLESISKLFSVSSFSQELGVICHFLCDFFCVPHSERWEFKHSMSKHITYEKELASFAKEFVPSNNKINLSKVDNTNDFIKNLHNEYKKQIDYKNDMIFSNFICNSVVDYILDCILNNSISNFKRTFIMCG